jgi:23S rRNA pseudouridine1911/1915/1917 synthase
MMSTDSEASFVAGEAEAGRRLDVVLAELLDQSRSTVAAAIVAGRVQVTGASARRSRTLALGERIDVMAAPAAEAVIAPPVPPIRYQDADLMVIAKPPGLVVHPGSGHHGDTLVDALRAAGLPLAPAREAERPGIVHRLDRDTSGLLLIASSPVALERLSAQLADRSVGRRYLALLIGEPADARGVVDAPIARHPTRKTRFAVVEGGRSARTRYRVLAANDVSIAPDDPDGEPRTRRVSSVVCALETGRTHQIRVHLAAIGTPVVGDPVYGGDRGVSAHLGLERPALHAAHLAFVHPTTGEAMEFTEPLPDELRTAWERAGLALPDGLEQP